MEQDRTPSRPKSAPPDSPSERRGTRKNRRDKERTVGSEPSAQSAPADPTPVDVASETAPPQESRLKELEAVLSEKEQLVSILTKRLEQAAEQLDRIHRSGGDRGARTVPGIPHELVEQQSELLAELQRAVEQWEELQTAATLGRIEVQVEELRDLISSRTWEPQPSPSGQRAGEVAQPKKEPPQTEKPVGGNTGLPSSAWETMKADFLAKSGADIPPGDAHAQGNDQTIDAPAPDAADHRDGDRIWGGSITDVVLPEPVDFEAASREELQEAIDSRDRYIVALTNRLQSVPNTVSIPTDWSALSDLPVEQKETLLRLQKELEEKLRVAEVGLSLERARLARESAMLAHREEQLARAAKKMGLQSPEDAKPATATENLPDDPKGRRWLRFMAAGRNPPG